MLNFNSLFLLFFASTILISCDYKPKTGQIPSKNEIDSNDLLCNSQGYDALIKLTNQLKINNELSYHVNTLSGAALIFKNVIESKDKIEDAGGLLQACDLTYEELELSCEGQIYVKTTDGQKLTLSRNDLLTASPVYVKTTKLCNTLSLKKGETLFIVTETVLFNRFSIELDQESVLSISAQKIQSHSSIDSVKQASGSAVRLHAYQIE